MTFDNVMLYVDPSINDTYVIDMFYNDLQIKILMIYLSGPYLLLSTCGGILSLTVKQEMDGGRNYAKGSSLYYKGKMVDIFR